MNFRRWMRVATISVVSVLSLAVAPAVYADESLQASGTLTISFSPVSVLTADGNTFIDYTFLEQMRGTIDGTRVGSGWVVIYPDGSFKTANSGVFRGTIAGASGTAVIHYRGSGTFASAAGRYRLTNGTGGLAGIHGKGTDSGSATGPTSFAGTYTFTVHFNAPDD